MGVSPPPHSVIVGIHVGLNQHDDDHHRGALLIYCDDGVHPRDDHYHDDHDVQPNDDGHYHGVHVSHPRDVQCHGDDFQRHDGQRHDDEFLLLDGVSHGDDRRLYDLQLHGDDFRSYDG